MKIYISTFCFSDGIIEMDFPSKKQLNNGWLELDEPIQHHCRIYKNEWFFNKSDAIKKVKQKYKKRIKSLQAEIILLENGLKKIVL